MSESVASIISPEVLKPYPKASARKNNVKSRQLKTRILTDSPVRNEIRLSKEMKTLKQTKQQKKVATKEKKMRETKNYLLIKVNVNQKLLHNLTLTNDDNIKETL